MITTERVIVYKSSKSMNRSSRRTRIINKKLSKNTQVSQKMLDFEKFTVK